MGAGGRLGGAACRKIEHMPHLSGTAPPHAGLRFPEPARRFAGRAGGARASLRGERMLQSPPAARIGRACETGEVPDGELEGVGGGAWGDWVLSLCSLGGACILAVTWSAILETEESKKRPPSEDITMCQP